MRILINNEPVECEAYSFGFGDESHDLMDGIIISMPGHYIFLSDHVEAHRQAQADLPDDIEHFDFSGCEIDWQEEPFCHIAKAVGRMIVRTAEKVCIEACDE
jgi:hypothetical protein